MASYFSESLQVSTDKPGSLVTKASYSYRTPDLRGAKLVAKSVSNGYGTYVFVHGDQAYSGHFSKLLNDGWGPFARSMAPKDEAEGAGLHRGGMVGDKPDTSFSRQRDGCRSR